MNRSNEWKYEELKRLYEEVRSCHCCPDVDHCKVPIKIEAINWNAEVMIISEALAQEQVRKSGVNFFKNDGTLGNTGKNLECLLNQLDQTIYPRRRVKLFQNHYVPSKSDKDRDQMVTVYNTEIVHCFPRRKGRANRYPTPEEIRTCIHKRFVCREIDIVDPKIIFLMGKRSYESFFRYFLGQDPKLILTKKIEMTARNGEYELYKAKYPIIPIQHASGANPRFPGMCKNRELLDLIQDILRARKMSRFSGSINSGLKK